MEARHTVGITLMVMSMASEGDTLSSSLNFRGCLEQKLFCVFLFFF